MSRTLTLGLLFAALPAFAQTNFPPLLPVTVSDLPAESIVYYNLTENRQVDTETATSDSDSWEVSFNGTSIAMNGEVRFVDQGFDDVTVAPSDGYVTPSDNKGALLPGGSGTGWYYYDMDVHIITPLANKTIVFKTKAGKYGKMEIISYYEGGIEGFGDPRYYTFRYAVQHNGSDNLVSDMCGPDSMECKVEQ